MFHWDDTTRFRVSPCEPGDLRHADVVRLVEELRVVRPEAMRVEPLGESAQGRVISSVTIGSGPRKVLAWSQMHGNEPTHTAVLLDLLSLLQNDPQHAGCSALLSGCTLRLIVMLNPDGAELWTRHNALGIDVNRDARSAPSPEGKILKRAVEEFRPEVALNLHNQHPRTMVAQSLQLASVALLVPAVDPQLSETEGSQLAKQLASCFRRAVEPHCSGRIARYRAEYMPRAFGEWVQGQGVATLLVEVGGWPGEDDSQLVQLHFHGLANTLFDLATDNHLQTDLGLYDSLPLNSEHRLFDRLIHDVTIVPRGDLPPFAADIGINFPRHNPRLNRTQQTGVIEEIGDLSVTTGKSVLEGQELICLPGRIVHVPEITPLALPDLTAIQQWLAEGVTTLVGRLDISQPEELDALNRLNKQFSLPINLAFVAAVTGGQGGWFDQLPERVVEALSGGILGFVAGNVVDEEAGCLERLNLSGRGAIGLEMAADVVLLRKKTNNTSLQTIDWADLRSVLVGGNVVFDQGKLIDRPAGTLLTHRWSAS